MNEYVDNKTASGNWRTTLFWLGALCLTSLLVFGFNEKGFYLSSVSDRPLHPKFGDLRSSGTTGLSFGVIGTLLILLNMAYLIRRHFMHAAWLGSLRNWMALHVFTGIVGSAIILFHSAFLPHSALGILSSLSLLVVVATGIGGRYIYGHVPRSEDGKELEYEDVRQRLSEYRTKLKVMKLTALEGDDRSEASSAPMIDSGLFSAIAGIIRSDREVNREYGLLQKEILHQFQTPSERQALLSIAQKYCKERQWLARYRELRFLMSSWRFFHRWFAVVMLATVAFHIIVAVRMGNLWIFSMAQ